MPKFKITKKLPFRSWYYFRIGWSTYFAFIFAAINTITVTYYLAIENIPSLKDIFPSFTTYGITVAVIGIPILVAMGYAHFKKSQSFKSETEILVESNGLFFIDKIEMINPIIKKIKEKKVISNTKELVKDFSWKSVAEKLMQIYVKMIEL